jgi:hypothetical protein
MRPITGSFELDEQIIRHDDFNRIEKDLIDFQKPWSTGGFGFAKNNLHYTVVKPIWF